MAGTDELVAILKKLRLSGVLQSLALRRQEAVDGALSFEEFLTRTTAPHPPAIVGIM